MEWYVPAAAIILMLIISPRFRVFTLFACLALSVMGGGYLFHSKYQEIRSKRLIPVHDIEIHDMALQVTSFGNYKITGRIDNNNADYTLNRVSIRMIVEDCHQMDSGDTGCEVIGEVSEEIYVNSPPRQSRDFDQYVYFFGSKPKTPGKLNWHYIVLHTHGERHHVTGK